MNTVNLINITHSGSSIAKNKCVFFDTNNVVTQLSNSFKTTNIIGITVEAISNGDATHIAIGGVMTLDTRDWNLGDTLYCNSTGDLVNTVPTGNWVIQIAKVLSVDGLGTIEIIPRILNDKIIFVNSKYDFPLAISGVINLIDNVTYFINSEIDLDGDRLVAGQNTTIIGASSENCRIKSTGLTSDALITSEWSLPLRFITIEADIALDLDATANANQALDWFGVNFTDCATIGTIKSYNNFIMNDAAFLNSGGLTFDGTFGTIGFINCLFDTDSGQTAIILPSTLTITRRFRLIYSSFITGSGETSLNVSSSVTIPNEGYILDTINFSGAGTYLTGVDHTYNRALFINCRGITNTGYITQYYMTSNATTTPIAVSGTFYKILGTTTNGTYIEKFTNTNNRATYDGSLSGYFKVTALLSCSSGNNHILEARIAKNATTTASSQSRFTTSGSGAFDNMKVQDIVLLNTNDYIEIFITNTSATTSVLVTELNVIIERLN